MKRRPLPSSYRRPARLLTTPDLCRLLGTPSTPRPATTLPSSTPPRIAAAIRARYRST